MSKKATKSPKPKAKKKDEEEEPSEFAQSFLKNGRHCDEYVSDISQPVCLRFFLFVQRLPAVLTMLCHQAGVRPKLFADFNGKRVRVTMASRFGDVGITENKYQEDGYTQRVNVAQLSNFSEWK